MGNRVIRAAEAAKVISMSPPRGLPFSQLVLGSGLAGRWEGVDPLISSVVEDSREVRPGSCFVARSGLKADGHTFVEGAVKAGASAVILERPLPLPPSIARLRVESARGVAGRLASVLYGLDDLQRAGRLNVIGITGTNGKSTFCFLMRAILRRAGLPTALFGTIEYDLLSRTVEARYTTPPATELMVYLAEAARAGATHAVMEVSSMALDQGRCEGIRFTVGVFSNLTGDHLDYHHDMGSYLRAKKRLFDGLAAGATAVVNAEDPACEQMVAGCRARVMRYGIVSDKVPADRLDLAARVHEFTARGTRFELIAPRGEGAQGGSLNADGAESLEIDSPLVGRHNVQNSLAAAGAAIASGVSLQTVAAGLAGCGCVPGRLQRVLPPDGRERGFTVLVDYAHTDDALANVLSALRPLTRGRLVVLFGCGGDRDNTKRPRMARVAAQWADRIVVTSDNPRTEDPEAIIRQILTGFEPGQMSGVLVEPDRRQAIAAAVAEAREGDVVLLAGKGHENYQIIGTERLPFDDAQVAAEEMEKK